MSKVIEDLDMIMEELDEVESIEDRIEFISTMKKPIKEEWIEKICECHEGYIVSAEELREVMEKIK